MPHPVPPMQLDGKVPIQVAENLRNIQFQSQVQTNGTRPNAILHAVQLNAHTFPTLSTAQRSIKQLAVDNEKTFEPNSTDQLCSTPLPTELAHSGTLSVAYFPNQKRH